ncbi:hypothetical protein [Dankookia rubra]|nr:hypothetical protein [Dankookia rubra]
MTPHRALMTLPASIFFVGMVACALPVGAIARGWGRHAAFLAARL